MASETLQPDGVTSAGGDWGGSPDAVNLELNVDEGVDSADGDTSYDQSQTSAGSLILTMDDTTLTGSISSIRIRLSAKKTETGGSTMQLFVQPRISSSGLGELEASLGTTYQIDELVWTGSWTPGAINTLEVELRSVPDGMNADLRVSAVEAVVTESTTAIGQAQRIQPIMANTGVYRGRPKLLTIKRWMLPPPVPATVTPPINRKHPYALQSHLASRLRQRRSRVRRVLRAPTPTVRVVGKMVVLPKPKPPFRSFFVPPPKAIVVRDLMHTPTGQAGRVQPPLVRTWWMPVGPAWHPPPQSRRFVVGKRQIIVAGMVPKLTLEACLEIVTSVAEELELVTGVTECLAVVTSITEDLEPQ